jgi:hypothetical protein
MISSKIRMAYILGCKMASIDNANDLSRVMTSSQNNITSKNPELDFGVMQNGEEKSQTEAGAPYGEKHQLSINPEWTGP